MAMAKILLSHPRFDPNRGLAYLLETLQVPWLLEENAEALCVILSDPRTRLGTVHPTHLQNILQKARQSGQVESASLLRIAMAKKGVILDEEED